LVARHTVHSSAHVDPSLRRLVRPTWRTWALVAAVLSSTTGCLAEVSDTEAIDTEGLSADTLKSGGASPKPVEIHPVEDPDGPPQMGGAGDACLQACLDQLTMATDNCDGNSSCQSKALQKYTACAQACPDDYPDPGSPGFGGGK
jgi:hypothetical protein